MDYAIISELILDKILNNKRKNIDEYYIESYNELFNTYNEDDNYFYLSLIFIIFIMIYTKFRFIFHSNTIFNYT